MLVLLFVVVPLAELYVIIQVGQAIGALATIALLLADSLLGAWLARSQGRAVWRRFQEALAAGRVPAREVLDGALVIAGGALLLAPGFLTDVVGALLLIPPSRALARHAVARGARGRLLTGLAGATARRDGAPPLASGLRRGRDRARDRSPPPAPVIGPEHETARSPERDDAAFGDAVTFTFADLDERLYGSARLGLSPGPPPAASGLGALFVDDELVALDAAGGIELGAPGDWTRLEAGDVRAAIVEPLQAWEVAYDGEGGGFELRFEALGEPAEIGGGAAIDGAALHGYEQLCRVTGGARAGDRRWRVECLGQRGHQWGAPDWERIELARMVSVWFEEGDGIALASVRPAGAPGHEAEAMSASRLAQPAPIAQALLSTALDGEGRQRRAGLELRGGEDDAAIERIAGEAVCGTTLDLGRLRLEQAFFHWRSDGRRGAGRYDVLRRA